MLDVPEVIKGLEVGASLLIACCLTRAVEVELHTELVITLSSGVFVRPAQASKDEQPTIVASVVFHDGHSCIPPFFRTGGPRIPLRIITRGPKLDPGNTRLAIALTSDFTWAIIGTEFESRCALKKGYVHVVAQDTVFS